MVTKKVSSAKENVETLISNKHTATKKASKPMRAKNFARFKVDIVHWSQAQENKKHFFVIYSNIIMHNIRLHYS